MAFHEKSNLAMLAILTLVFGIYFLWLMPQMAAADPLPPAAAVAGVLIPFVLCLVMLTGAVHLVFKLRDWKETGEPDERARLIETRAEARAGFVLALGVFGALTLLLVGAAPFWIANALLGALVLAELVKGMLRAVGYRRS